MEENLLEVAEYQLGHAVTSSLTLPLITWLHGSDKIDDSQFVSHKLEIPVPSFLGEGWAVAGEERKFLFLSFFFFFLLLNS